MKQAIIYKGFEPEQLSAEELVTINHHTRRELGAQELYVFPLILCDNEVDRDYERFSVDALHKLRKLFLGKTGIFDHNPKGQNQTARIYSTAVEKDALRVTQTGEIYHFLTAKAYMVRSEKNKDLILDIDAGIKKEVSVGCAVDEVLCSICGADIKAKPCEHQAGKSYDGAVCHYILNKPADAYEWSFVAVPAQPAAGVTKAYAQTSISAEDVCAGTVLERITKCGGAITLSAAEAQVLGAELRRLSALAQSGEAYLSELKKDVLRAAALCGGGMSQKAVASIADKLSAEELRELKKTFTRTSAAPMVQLGGYRQEPDAVQYGKRLLGTREPDNAQFQI